MVLRKIFKSMYAAPAGVVARSRDASLYLMRAIFFMGIRPPPKRFMFLYLLWSFVLNTVSTFYQPIGFTLSAFLNSSDFKPSELLTSLQVTFNAWSCSIKVLTVKLMIHRLDKANEILDELDKRCTRKEEQQQIRVTTALSNRILFTYMIIYFSYAITTFVSGIFNGTPPYQLYYPILNWRASKLQLWIQTLLEYISMGGACYQDVCVDCYPVNYILPLRTHIKILTERVGRLGADDTQSNDELHDELINCISDHKTLLRYCDTIRPLVSRTVFVQFAVTSLAIGLTLINIVVFADFAYAVAAMCFLITVLSETMPLCVICSFLEKDCDKLADAAFQSRWINAEQRYKKTLLYFIQNLQQPIVFKAFNVVPIAVSTSISILKFSFSVFTLVKQMNLGERFADKME